MVSFMMGKGDVNLSNSIRESVVGPIREEIRKEFEALIKEKDVRIASLLSELDKLKGNDEGCR